MATYYMNVDTMKYWNVEKAAWVDTVDQATDLGHGAKVPAKPKGSIRVRVPVNS